MRKAIVAIGVLLLFLGVFLLGISRIAVQSTPDFPTVAKTTSNADTNSLNVSGNFARDDIFKLFFTPNYKRPDVASQDNGVFLDFTDPSGNTVNYEVAITIEGGNPYLEGQFPTGFVNQTGIYTLKAFSYGYGMYLRSLELQKVVEKPPLYPYYYLLPASFAIVIGGTGASLWGAKKPPQPKRRR